MEFVNPNVTIDFMRHRTPVVLISLALVTLSLASLFWPGPNYGIDFAGGTEVQLQFGGEITSFQYGTGPIKGFAVMLMIGIITSLFTGIFCSKVFFDFIVRGLKVERLRVG